MVEERRDPIFIDVSCPRCNIRNKYEVFYDIQSDVDLRAKQLLLDGRLFEYKCKSCRCVADILYEIVYYDAKHNAMLYFVEQSEVDGACIAISETEQDAKMEWSELIADCKKRVVDNPRTLQEKAMVFEEDMDDRVVEIVKVVCMDIVCEEGQVAKKRMLFDVQDGEYCFKLFVDNSVVMIAFPQNVYDYVQNKFEKILDSNGDCIVDEDWARNFVKKYGLNYGLDDE